MTDARVENGLLQILEHLRISEGIEALRFEPGPEEALLIAVSHGESAPIASLPNAVYEEMERLFRARAVDGVIEFAPDEVLRRKFQREREELAAPLPVETSRSLRVKVEFVGSSIVLRRL